MATGNPAHFWGRRVARMPPERSIASTGNE